MSEATNIRALAPISELSPEVTPWFPPEVLYGSAAAYGDGAMYYEDAMWAGQPEYYMGGRRGRGRGGGRRAPRAGRAERGERNGVEDRLGKGGRGGRGLRSGGTARGLDDEDDEGGRGARSDKGGRGVRPRGRGSRGGEEWGGEDWDGRAQQPSSTSRTAEFEEAYQKNLKLLSGASLGRPEDGLGAGTGTSPGPSMGASRRSESTLLWAGTDTALASAPLASTTDKAASRSAREAKREEERERDRLEREARDREEALHDDDFEAPFFDAAIHSRADLLYRPDWGAGGFSDAMALYAEKKRQEEIERELSLI